MSGAGSGHSYKRPPIVEALLEIQFETPISPSEVLVLKRKNEGIYQTVLDTQEIEATITPSGSVTSKVKNSGFRAQSEDGRDVLVIGLSNIINSRLPPYGDWASFSLIARRNFETYRDVVGYRKPKRVGIRYINRIDVPKGDIPPDGAWGLLNFVPLIPEPFPQSAQNFQVRVEFPFGKHDLQVILQASSAVPVLIGFDALLLDVDVYRVADLPANLDEIWPIIEEARIAKNAIFESSIKPILRSIFDR